ncbi:hypothetical protein Tco_0621644 [Tanacetum coccineum]
MDKFETPPDSSPVIVIAPDDQPMWSSTRTVASTPSSAIIQLPNSDNFFIKGTHMQMIRDHQFNRRIQSDPHRHIANFLEISNLFQYGENQEKTVMLRTFPFSLSVEAKNCVGTGRMKKKEIKKDGMGLPKELNKEWKLNKKVLVMKEDAWR